MNKDRDSLILELAHAVVDSMDIDAVLDYVYQDQVHKYDTGDEDVLLDDLIDFGIITPEEADEIVEKGW